MKSMPDDVRLQFMEGHNAGLFNDTWSDMAIETTFMGYGHGHSGITGITLKPETVKAWEYSLHACISIVRDLNEIRDKEHPSAQTHHKEEITPRKKYDEKTRKALHNKLEGCIKNRVCERCHR